MIEEGYDEDARWLLSDAQILGRITTGSHEQGTLITLVMPEGENFVAAVEKMNADSMTQFCELARGEYGERKAEQAAQASRVRFDEREPESVPEGTQGTQEAVVVNPMDLSSVTRRLIEIGDEQIRLVTAVENLQKEREILSTIWGMLDAPEDATEEPPSVPTAEGTESAGESEVVDTTTRSEESVAVGQETTGKND